MPQTVRKFDYDLTIHGARVLATSDALTAGCLAEGEIDTAIQMLKDDLDAVAKRMKLAVKTHRQSLLFPEDASP